MYLCRANAILFRRLRLWSSCMSFLFLFFIINLEIAKGKILQICFMRISHPVSLTRNWSCLLICVFFFWFSVCFPCSITIDYVGVWEHVCLLMIVWVSVCVLYMPMNCNLPFKLIIIVIFLFFFFFLVGLYCSLCLLGFWWRIAIKIVRKHF